MGMNVYVAKDENNEVLAIVMSDSQEKANIAFYAMGHSPTEIDVIWSDSSLGVGGVIFVANKHTEETRYGELRSYMKRGI